MSEETAQYSACISWATLRASFSIRLYCAGVCQPSRGWWVGDGDSPAELGHREPVGRGGHSRSGPSWSPPRRGSRWMGRSPSGRQPATACGGPLSPVGGQALPSCSHDAALPAARCPPARLSPLHPAPPPPTLGPSPPSAPWPRVTYRVCSRDATSLTSKTITMAGEGGRKGEMGTGTADVVGRGGDLTLRSSVVGGGNALEAFLASRVPPGEGGVREVRGGCRGAQGGGWHLLTAAG